MANYTNPKYDDARNWMKKARENGRDWEQIRFGTGSTDDDLAKFLKDQEINNFWDYTVEDWKELVGQQKVVEEEQMKITEIAPSTLIVGEDQENETSIPDSEGSAWVNYKNHLLDNSGFSNIAIANIEDSSYKILKQLSKNTIDKNPKKGLVIGNVQSGKTANMAGVMSMAADWGWNIFIVLSGTIENLRVQTQKRMLNDLNHPGKLYWRELGHLSRNPEERDKLSFLHLEEGNPNRYFTVVLKNATRLKNLLDWLHSDENKKKNMNIVIIDDESDQAGINTMDVNSEERNTISRLINNLVHGRDKHDKLKAPFRSVNYIGYTATPYANVLNEIGDHTLFPKDFIFTLPQSRQYFGPQQIFGVNERDIKGLDIVRILEKINPNEIVEVNAVHQKELLTIPKGLEQSIIWFVTASAALRYKGYRKPLSMLIHTSFKVDHHEALYSAIQEWFKRNRDEFVEKANKMWKEETERFTLDRFRQSYPDYELPYDSLNDYPEFRDFLPELMEILEEGIGTIKIDEDEENSLSYFNGIHACIDNSKSQRIAEEDDYMRLDYPTKEHDIEKAPLFIVVGGNTLARGLTIEGLISTYFLRTTSQADTLMQMGRWFGYRKGYELYPRIFLSSNANERFKFLSTLDVELRESIKEMETLGIKPERVGVRIKNTPSVSFMRITSQKKMQSAIESELDFTGITNQTVLFENDYNKLNYNLELTDSFLKQLGSPTNSSEFVFSKNNYVWENINFEEKLKPYLEKFKFSPRARVFNRIDSIIEWIELTTKRGDLDSWNIIVSSINSKTNQHTINDEIIINKVKRTRKNDVDDVVIDIGVLQSPSDILSDIRLNQLEKLDNPEQIMKKIKDKPSAKERDIAGLSKTPQLLIYYIDKDSGHDEDMATRNPLNAEQDIVGIVLTIPGGNKNKNYAKAIRISPLSVEEELDVE